MTHNYWIKSVNFIVLEFSVLNLMMADMLNNEFNLKV